MQRVALRLHVVIRRALGCFLMFSFCLFMLEVAAPDVHDDDASVDELANLGGAIAVPSPAGPTDWPAPASDSPATHDDVDIEVQNRPPIG